MPQFNPNNPRREEYDADHRKLDQRIAALEMAVSSGSASTARRTAGTIVSAPSSVGGNTSQSAPSASLLTVSDGTNSYPNVPILIFAGGWTITQNGSTGAATVAIVGIDDSP